MKYLSVRMVCEDLRRVPKFNLPASCLFRWYHPGDERAWVDIQSRSDRYNVISKEQFILQFGERSDELRRRQLFLCDADGTNPIGTITAWFAEAGSGRAYGDEYGRVHWVAIVPERQGRGLAKPMMSAVCRRLLELGSSKAYLTTASVRIAALNLYFACAFRPDLHTAKDRHAWRILAEEGCGEAYKPELLTWLRENLGVQMKRRDEEEG